MDTPPVSTGATEQPDLNVGALAGVTHLLFFAQTIGIVVAVVLWVTRGREHRNLAFQCAQSLFFQAGFFVVNIAFWMVAMVFWVGGSLFVAGLSSAESNTAGGVAAGIGLVAFFAGLSVFFLLWIAGAGVSIWLAVRCFQGHEPVLPVIGTLATRATDYRPAPAAGNHVATTPEGH